MRRAVAVSVVFGLAVALNLSATVHARTGFAHRATHRLVRVPRVTARWTLPQSYRRLRRHGLRMAVPRPFALGSLYTPGAQVQSPPAGKRVPRGTTVRLRGIRGAVGTPGIPIPPPPLATVPDLGGQPLSAAVEWASGADVLWSAELPPLRPSRRPELLDNYLVSGEDPPAGTVIDPSLKGLGLTVRAAG
jgi:hypothetical protein